MQYLLIESRPDIESVLNALASSHHIFVKFLSANDLGLTGGHQAGIYIAKDAYPVFSDQPGSKGENYEREIAIRWPGTVTRSSFKWYGSKSRSEYRLTRTSGFFTGREDYYTGSLLVLAQLEGDHYAWALNHDDDIEDVLNFLGIAPSETNRLIRFDFDERLRPGAMALLSKSGNAFPDTETIARYARDQYESLYRTARHAPDRMILELIRIEFSLFRFVERELYRIYLERPFESVEDLLTVSLQINNRRKSRAGKSLELHLKYIFDLNGVPHSHGERSEMEKRPDFIFPSIEAYRDPAFPDGRLFILGAKTTCKDRWRQVLSEADRIPVKYLFTLQQGLSSSQLREMDSSGVIPVVPEEYHDRFRAEDRKYLLTLSGFIDRILTANGRQASLFQ